MSMIGNFLQMTSEELEKLKLGTITVESFLFPDGAFPDCCTVDKAWQGIHFLLAGDPWEGEGVEAKAVLGGEPIGDDLGYGPARYLTATEVKEVANAIGKLNADELRSRFDASAMAEADIYSFHPEDADDELEYFVNYFEELNQYYQEAAGNGQAMLLFLS